MLFLTALAASIANKYSIIKMAKLAAVPRPRLVDIFPSRTTDSVLKFAPVILF
ncbi:MAG: hypothetical protein ACJAYB_001817 [Psychromonas sp.]|jgi:hypothetical protein